MEFPLESADPCATAVPDFTMNEFGVPGNTP
jgi:hypothetical protein